MFFQNERMQHNIGSYCSSMACCAGRIELSFITCIWAETTGAATAASALKGLEPGGGKTKGVASMGLGVAAIAAKAAKV